MIKEVEKYKQFTTFYIQNHLYGIDVMTVQEVTLALPTTRVPYSPAYVAGLINLRGQISTAISLRELFNLPGDNVESPMNVVCKWEDQLFSLVIDRIGDVMDLSDSNFESPPETLPETILQFISGVYKTDKDLVSIIDVKKIMKQILS